MLSDYLLIGNENERRRIKLHSILYIQTDDYLSTFYLISYQKFVCSIPLSELADILPENFFQISRSCMVNLDEVFSLKRKCRKIILNDATELMVSLRRVKPLNDALARQNMALAR